MSYYREPTYLISFMFRRILVPIDGSASSLKALDIALDFAKRYGSKLTALIVNDKTINVEEVSGEISSRARKSGIEVVLKIKEIRNPNESVVSKVLEEISEGSYDLVILGARGRTLSEDLLIGSTALSVIINSPISCLVVR
ncbi:MAG: universal stress protein [Sulfolobales archaeon]|jgi:nucleotide-binding universal stress UspA family protein